MTVATSVGICTKRRIKESNPCGADKPEALKPMVWTKAAWPHSLPSGRQSGVENRKAEAMVPPPAASPPLEVSTGYGESADDGTAGLLPLRTTANCTALVTAEGLKAAPSRLDSAFTGEPRGDGKAGCVVPRGDAIRGFGLIWAGRLMVRGDVGGKATISVPTADLGGDGLL
jgi:hypothetical protein